MSHYTHVLDHTSMQYPGTRRHPDYGLRVYRTKSDTPPRGLHPYLARPHTWEAHVQRLINNETAPTRAGAGVTPRNDKQATMIDGIAAAYHDSKPGYVVSYPTGFGKTYTAVAAVNKIAPARALVITPLAYVDGWRSVIEKHATGSTEWVVINPDRLTILFRTNPGYPALHTYHHDDRTTVALETGMPVTQFDIVITDEAQILANSDSNRTRLWQALVGWDNAGNAPAAFTLNLSATNWSHPMETVSAAHILAASKNLPVPSTLELRTDYEQWLRDNFGLSYTSGVQGRWRWDKNTADLDRLAEALYEKGMGAAAGRDDLGMAPQARSVHHITLSASERDRYPQSWKAFLLEQGLPGSDTAVESADVRSRYMRQIQKAAIIKAPYVADLVVDYLERGYQVIVPAWLTHTINQLSRLIQQKATDRLGKAPEPGRWAIDLTGKDTGETRDIKIRGFQSGYFPCIITSVATSISLHANEKGGGLDGERATSAPRVTIFGDVRWGGKQSIQAEGRGARDGEEADAIYCVALDTAEVKAMSRVFRALSNTKALGLGKGMALSNKDIEAFSALADELELELNEEN